jgi:hypothetical protein
VNREWPSGVHLPLLQGSAEYPEGDCVTHPHTPLTGCPVTRNVGGEVASQGGRRNNHVSSIHLMLWQSLHNKGERIMFPFHSGETESG